ncbi:MAG: membrane protein insertase YidC, partial [Rhodanobacteraceae bacterium]|nr:membrane protein insertase YidC [Rhodanobacteraceae bacterium]
MSNLRLFLLLGLALVGLQLWSAWQKDYGPSPENTAVTTETALPASTADGVPVADATVAGDEIPTAPSETPATAEAMAAAPAATAASDDRRITIASDVLRLTVSLRGAEIRQAELLTYPISLEQKNVPVKLLNEEVERYFVSQTGLVAKDQPAPDHTASYAVDGDKFELAAGSDAIEVPLTWTDPSGVSVRKVIRLERGSFTVGVRQEITNQSATPWRGSQYRQMQRVPPPKPSAFAFNNPELYAYVGAAVYSPDEKFQKLKFDNFVEEPFQRTFAGGWSA